MCKGTKLPGIKDMLIRGIFLVAIVCMQGITRAEASICFLPSGECDHKITLQSESCKSWTSTEREQVCSAKNGYVKAAEVAAKESSGYSCSSAISLGDTCCPGWYYCTEVNCQDKGFKLKEQWDPRYYVCSPCTQGGITFYKCEDKPCNYNSNNPTASTLDDVCTNTNGKYCVDSVNTNKCDNGYVWKADSSRKAGTRSCGKCVKTDNPPSPPPCTGEDCVQCKNNTYYWKETLPSGCVTCVVAGDVTGREYYCCHDINEYPVANCRDDDNACYTCEGPVEARGYEYYNETGTVNCYKHVDKKCGNANQYIDRKLDGCYCRNYDYYLNANPTTLHFTAAGGTKTVSVVSTIASHMSTDNYPYVTQTGKIGLCTVTDNGSGTVTVKCGFNTSTSAKSTSFNITQTPKKVTNEHKVLRETITISINGDTCYQYQFSQTCSQSGWRTVWRRKSESKQADCYECLDDNCPSGYTKGTTPSPAEGFLTKTTDYGSNCYKAKTCADGSTTTNRRSNGECYNCSKHGYAGQAQCWLCTHMDTTCDAAKGWVWSESSCSCVPVGCTTGDVSKQKVEDCGTSGSNGWKYSYSGMSGGKKCGICEKKPCSGNSTTDLSKTNSNYSCTNCWYGDTQRFTCTCNLTDTLCGAGKKADMSTCTCKTCEDNCSKHGWTSNSSSCDYGSTPQSSICNIQCYSCNACTDSCSNHTGWVSSCTPGCSGNYKITCTNQTDNCGGRCYTSNSTYCSYGCSGGDCKPCSNTCPVSGEKKSTSELSCSCGTTTGTSTQCGTTCYKCKPNDTCANHGWKSYSSSCTYGYNVKYDNCGHTCYECKPCTPGDGWWGSVCCSDSDCKVSSEFPLYCFDGRCYECGNYQDDCNVNSRFYSKYGSSATGCYLGNHNGPGGSYQYDDYKTSVDDLKTAYSHRINCRSGECTGY